jgi:ferrous iron transport protein B
MWFLAVAENGPGTVLTDWANDGFLADGWHLPFTTHECREEGKYKGMEFEDAQGEFAKAEATVAAWEAGEKKASIEDEETGEIAEEWDIDEAAYNAAKEFEEPDPGQFGVWVPGLGALITEALDRAHVNDTVKSLVVDGAWGGVATVLGFVPVIFIVFLFLAFLEDCGYMARVAFIMDRLLRRFGLSGKSFIPMLVGKGCGVPAVMAARAIENERARRMTVILATFVPCGAKTVIIAMFAALFFREQWYVAAMMDVVGIAIIILGGIALKKTRFFAGEASSFVLELPAYHMPTVSGVWHHTWNRLKGYILKAGLVIFPACVFLWFIMHFDWSLNLLADEEIEKSILHDLGSWIAWIFEPLGFGSWQGAAASVSAEIAKEQATATLKLVTVGMEGVSSGAHIQNFFAALGDFPKLAALSFMMFNLFVPPCMVAIAVTFREMGSQKWGWFAVGFQLFVGYVLALSVYRLGVLFAGGGFGIWTALALALDAFCLWAIVRRVKS